MKILSIDWDWFFPDSYPYDWGHNENMFFLNSIWTMRLTAHNVITGKEAFSEYTPTIPEDFWKRTVKSSTSSIYLAESHASITAMPFTKAILTNLDAHHDCGYGNNPTLDCGNWAWHLKDRIKEYHLCYPLWRKTYDEATPRRRPDTVTFGLPQTADYDLIFVCRSGCWTPPWYDSTFKSWLKQSELPIRPIDNIVGQNRPMSLAKAIKMKTSMMAIERKIHVPGLR